MQSHSLVQRWEQNRLLLNSCLKELLRKLFITWSIHAVQTVNSIEAFLLAVKFEFKGVK